MHKPDLSSSRSSNPSANPIAPLRGLARLGVDATQGVLGVVEQVHRTVHDRAWPLAAGRAARTTGLTGAIYSAIRQPWDKVLVTGGYSDGPSLGLFLGRYNADGSPDEQGTAFQKGFGGMFVRPGGVLVDNFTEDKRI